MARRHLFIFGYLEIAHAILHRAFRGQLRGVAARCALLRLRALRKEQAGLRLGGAGPQGGCPIIFEVPEIYFLAFGQASIHYALDRPLPSVKGGEIRNVLGNHILLGLDGWRDPLSGG